MPFEQSNTTSNPPWDLRARYVALLVAGLLAAVCIRSGLFVAGGSDSSAYVSAGELWRTRTIFRPEPLHFWVTWPNARDSVLPLGYREGPISGTEVVAYPSGMPILIAAATALVGPFGSALVAPIMAGVLVWCAFGIARQLGGAGAGLIAAVLVASSPELLMHSVQAMSDAPAAACWIAAWWFSLRGTVGAGAASGLLTCLAILIRPNLAPLGAVIGGTILFGDRTPTGARTWRWQASLVFAALSALGPGLLVWTQATLYGSPFTPSYPGWETLFSRAYIAPNVGLYLRLFTESHTLLPLTGLLMVPIVGRPGSEADRAAKRVTTSACALIAVNVALYLPYMPFDHWPFLRFLLPASTALFVLFSGLVALVTRVVWSRLRWVAVVVPLALVSPVVLQGAPFARYALNDWRAQGNIRLMGHYLREALPRNAVVLSFAHSGAVAYYTGRDIVRLDLLDPSTLDRVVDDLVLHGYAPVLVLDQHLEEALFRQRFSSSRFGHLDWPPRAEFVAVTKIWHRDLADREKYLRGARWPVDTVR